MTTTWKPWKPNPATHCRCCQVMFLAPGEPGPLCARCRDGDNARAAVRAGAGHRKTVGWGRAPWTELLRMSGAVTTNGYNPPSEPLAVTPCKACERHDRGLDEGRHCQTCHAKTTTSASTAGRVCPQNPNASSGAPTAAHPASAGTGAIARTRAASAPTRIGMRRRPWPHGPRRRRARRARSTGGTSRRWRRRFVAAAGTHDPRTHAKRARWAAEVCAACGEPITGTVWLRGDVVGEKIIATCEAMPVRVAHARGHQDHPCQACETKKSGAHGEDRGGPDPTLRQCKAPLRWRAGGITRSARSAARPGSWGGETEWTCRLPRHTPEYRWARHPLGCDTERPCAGCGRAVRRQVPAHCYVLPAPTFCSVRCRSRVGKDAPAPRATSGLRGRRRALRHARRRPGRTAPMRATASACRQRAYRTRVGQRTALLL